METNPATQNTDLNAKLVTAVTTAIKDLEYDVTKRNEYINLREQALYGPGLYNQIEFEIGQWFAEYNYCLRVVDVHTSQLMGRDFSIYSYYDKEDLDVYKNDPDQLEIAILRNKKAKANADLRKKAVDAMIRDNGGFARFTDGARIGSGFGVTIFKMWYDKKEKRVRYSLLESPQNYRAAWSDSDFRARDFDNYNHQVSETTAYRMYGDKLKPGEEFATTQFGQLFNETTVEAKPAESDRKMVTITELNGYISGWKGVKGKLVQCKRGDETPVNVVIAGGKLVQVITDEDILPNYYIINNRQEPRAAWGKSDLPQSALDINREIIQLHADMMTWANKNLFKLIQAIGFTPDGIPKKKPRKTQVVAMSPEQRLEEMQVALGTIDEFLKLINAKMEAFVRITGVGRVLFDDPSVNANSNQALQTTMKPVIDIVEDKQKRWGPALVEMFTDALKLAARDMPELKEAVIADQNWFLCAEFPPTLRKEDSQYQAMYNNRIMQGLISLESYMEKMGDDYSEEMDRMTDEMKNPVAAAVLGKMLGVLAQQTISPVDPNAPSTPPVKYSVNVKADATTDPLTNSAVVKEVMGAGEFQPQDAGSGTTPPDQYSPEVTPDQNTDITQAPSVPGSGQPQVSPEGAEAQVMQNAGA